MLPLAMTGIAVLLQVELVFKQGFCAKIKSTRTMADLTPAFLITKMTIVVHNERLGPNFPFVNQETLPLFTFQST